MRFKDLICKIFDHDYMVLWCTSRGWECLRCGEKHEIPIPRSQWARLREPIEQLWFPQIEDVLDSKLIHENKYWNTIREISSFQNYEGYHSFTKEEKKMSMQRIIDLYYNAI